MLAAESAWRIIHAEHAQMRELLGRIESITTAAGWREPGPELNSLTRLIHRLRSFDDATHRPKGVALFAALRGRESATDALIGRLEVDCKQRDRLLSEARAHLAMVDQGERRAADAAEQLLEQYGAMLRRDLDLEDTTLHAEAAKLLNADQWSAIASSISFVMSGAASRKRPDGTRRG